MSESFDLTIVGAGINGACAAAHAAAAGHRVLVVDKEQGPATEASGRAQGVIRLQGRDAAEIPLAQHAIARWHDIDDPERLELTFKGNLYFATKPDELPELQRLSAEAERGGHSAVEILTPDQVRDIVPSASGAFLAAMWSAEDGHCEPALATQYFLDRAQHYGVTIRYNETAIAIDDAGGRTRGVRLASGYVSCGAVIVAAGVWTPHLLAESDLRIPVMPVELSEREVGPLPPLFAPAIRANGFGGKQRPGGSIVLSNGLNAVVRHRLSLYDTRFAKLWARRLIAHARSLRLQLGVNETLRQIRTRSTCSTAHLNAQSDEPAADDRRLDKAQAAMADVFPAIDRAPTIRSWAGAVDMSPDGLPIIDTPFTGTAYATGLSGHGFTLGPALGPALVDLATEGRTDQPVTPFIRARFDGRVAIPTKTM